MGILCEPLCTEKGIHSLACETLHAGKEAVFSAHWETTRLVFKASRYTSPFAYRNIIVASGMPPRSRTSRDLDAPARALVAFASWENQLWSIAIAGRIITDIYIANLFCYPGLKHPRSNSSLSTGWTQPVYGTSRPRRILPTWLKTWSSAS